MLILLKKREKRERWFCDGIKRYFHFARFLGIRELNKLFQKEKKIAQTLESSVAQKYLLQNVKFIDIIFLYVRKELDKSLFSY